MVDDQRHIKPGLEGRLVEAGKGAAGVGRLELGDSVVALLGFGEVEAAQLVVEDAGVVDGKGGFTGRQLLAEVQGSLLLLRVFADLRGEGFTADARGYALELDLGRVERDRA